MGSGSERSGRTPGSDRKEHVMMFAFALALIGIAVLETLEHVAARS
jgi:hypothetical protein